MASGWWPVKGNAPAVFTGHRHPSTASTRHPFLAELYEVERKALTRAVKRNADRFPKDFTFQLTPQEAESATAPTASASTEVYGEIRMTMRKRLSRLSAAWCSIMHQATTWPIHGHYRCSQCNREFPVSW